jgi:Uncharacterized protein conserved in bacteria (DUF2344)
VARAFERGVRRAGLPIAYSAGFTPHPKISYAGGAPTGVASEAEYLSLALTSRQAATEVRERLNAALPDGIDVIDVMEDAPGGIWGDGQSPQQCRPGGSNRPPRGDAALAPTASVSPAGSVSPADAEVSGSSPSGSSGSFGGLEASEWRVELPGVGPEAAARAVAGFLALHEAPVERRTDKAVRHLDARAAVVEMDVIAADSATAGPDRGHRAAGTGGTAPAAGADPEECAILRMVVLHTAPAVRPEDVLTALRSGHGIAPSSPPLTTRLAQGSRTSLTGKNVS